MHMAQAQAQAQARAAVRHALHCAGPRRALFGCCSRVRARGAACAAGGMVRAAKGQGARLPGGAAGEQGAGVTCASGMFWRVSGTAGSSVLSRHCVPTRRLRRRSYELIAAVRCAPAPRAALPGSELRTQPPPEARMRAYSAGLAQRVRASVVLTSSVSATEWPACVTSKQGRFSGRNAALARTVSRGI
ncbi:hypothetical protein PsYK624_111530 [Phanerochaete sordida]|uniref:Uncharacterized protein n=1 Tax=Phanerochaete sordida TaxID=48140 RepID=A0A9P3LGX7_9APHY|nr:hypothetical protein PsYK624_111530 [Phanerochaete sordida]